MQSKAVGSSLSMQSKVGRGDECGKKKMTLPNRIFLIHDYFLF